MANRKTPEGKPYVKARHDLLAKIAPVKMSDESIAYNVVVEQLGTTLIFACESLWHAQELAESINRCAWIEAA